MMCWAGPIPSPGGCAGALNSGGRGEAATRRSPRGLQQLQSCGTGSWLQPPGAPPPPVPVSYSQRWARPLPTPSPWALGSGWGRCA